MRPLLSSSGREPNTLALPHSGLGLTLHRAALDTAQYPLLRAVVRIQQKRAWKVLSTPHAHRTYSSEGSWCHFLTSLGQKVSTGLALKV